MRHAWIRKHTLLTGIFCTLLFAVPAGAESTYTVKRGDMLPQIAARYAVTLDELCKLNKIYNPDVLYVGQVLRLPENAVIPAEPAPAAPTAPVAAKAPVAPAASSASNTPVTPVAATPVAPKLPLTMAAQPAAQVQVTPAATVAPAVPAMPEAPVAPKAPAVTAAPTKPVSAKAPAATVAPKAPPVAVAPITPAVPVTPKAPAPAKVVKAPATAKAPAAPVTPAAAVAAAVPQEPQGDTVLTGRELLARRQQILADRYQIAPTDPSQPALVERVLSVAETPKQATILTTPPANAAAEPAARQGIRPAANSRAGIVSTARNYLGTPYSRGGLSYRGIDCSGLVVRAMASLNRRVPHHAATLYRMGTRVTYEQLEPGDLVFFNTSGRGVSHVGIWIGENKFIHASSSRGVTVSEMRGYYSRRLVGARRIR